MDLAQELKGRIVAVEGRLALADLRAWMDARTHAIHDVDGEVDDLADRAWSLFAELDYGHRHEGEVRQVLAEALLLPTEPRR
jgi:hypothetical protein